VNNAILTAVSVFGFKHKAREIVMYEERSRLVYETASNSDQVTRYVGWDPSLFYSDPPSKY